MEAFDIRDMSRRALRKLEEEGVNKRKIHRYESVGFRTVILYFEGLGLTDAGDDLLREFLEKQYEASKNDGKLTWRWRTIRRSVELMKYFAATGRVDMPPLPRWTKRDCLLYIEPSPDQMADNDNIFGLIWRTRNALKNFGYAYRTLVYYDVSGFGKILNAHVEMEASCYSRKIAAQVVIDAHKRVETGKQYRFQAERKAAALLDEFHRYGVISPSTLSAYDAVPLQPVFETLVEEYGNDALLSGKLCAVTGGTAKSIVRGFLQDMESAGFSSFDGVTLATVSEVLNQSASSRYERGKDSLLHYVRDFLKYIYEYDIVQVDLSVAVPKMATPFKRVYQGFTNDEIRNLLAAVDRNTAIGKRDYAIMTLAAQTGLRSVDIVGLKRSDIDWRRNEINVFQSKTGKPLRLALEAESGNAIAEYLLSARQDYDIPNVFLCAENPLRPMRSQGMRGIITKYMAIAGINTSERLRYGFHSFRRAFGTRLLESGTSIHLLSQLLGHTDINSAKPYMSASEQGLKECGLSLVLTGEDGEAL
jgi:site-specific recombinase XerD